MTECSAWKCCNHPVQTRDEYADLREDVERNRAFAVPMTVCCRAGWVNVGAGGKFRGKCANYNKPIAQQAEE